MKITKIAIDVSPLHDGNAIRGVGYYTLHLVEALKQAVSSVPEYKNWQIDLITDPDVIKSSKYDLVHYPYFDPFKLTLPPRKVIPFIVTVHDLIPLQLKNMYPKGLKGSLKWLIQLSRLKSANYIITPSNYSKYIISDLTGYPKPYIYVTPLASPSDFKTVINTKLLDQVKNKYQLPSKFVLYVGDINRNKNIPTLATVCRQLNYPLVIVGSAAAKKDVPIHSETKDIHWLQNFHKKLSPDSPPLILTGFVPDAELPAIYNLATIYCQPSYIEGFGFTVLEAMQSGLPVIYSQESSLPEVMDFNGLPFDPYSPDSLKKALKRLWSDTSLQKELSKKGLTRAKIFSWKNTALQTLAVYQLALTDD